jgi:hypothetical protein
MTLPTIEDAVKACGFLASRLEDIIEAHPARRLRLATIGTVRSPPQARCSHR